MRVGYTHVLLLRPWNAKYFMCENQVSDLLPDASLDDAERRQFFRKLNH